MTFLSLLSTTFIKQDFVPAVGEGAQEERDSENAEGGGTGRNPFPF